MILLTQNQRRQSRLVTTSWRIIQAMARKVNVPAGRFLFFAHGIIKQVKVKQSVITDVYTGEGVYEKEQNST